MPISVHTYCGAWYYIGLVQYYKPSTKVNYWIRSDEAEYEKTRAILIATSWDIVPQNV